MAVNGSTVLCEVAIIMTPVLFNAVPVIGALRGCVVPCLRSMLSKVVTSEKLGESSVVLMMLTTGADYSS